MKRSLGPKPSDRVRQIIKLNGKDAWYTDEEYLFTGTVSSPPLLCTCTPTSAESAFLFHILTRANLSDLQTVQGYHFTMCPLFTPARIRQTNQASHDVFIKHKPIEHRSRRVVHSERNKKDWNGVLRGLSMGTSTIYHQSITQKDTST